MPPAGLPPRPKAGYAKTTGFLIRLKVVLDLIISDLFRIILAVLLFVAICAIAFAGLTYKQWIPRAESYFGVSLDAMSSTATSTTQ